MKSYGAGSWGTARVRVGDEWIYEEPVHVMRVVFGPGYGDVGDMFYRRWTTQDGVIVKDEHIVDLQIEHEVPG